MVYAIEEILRDEMAIEKEMNRSRILVDELRPLNLKYDWNLLQSGIKQKEEDDKKYIPYNKARKKMGKTDKKANKISETLKKTLKEQEKEFDEIDKKYKETGKPSILERYKKKSYLKTGKISKEIEKDLEYNKNSQEYSNGIPKLWDDLKKSYEKPKLNNFKLVGEIKNIDTKAKNSTCKFSKYLLDTYKKNNIENTFDEMINNLNKVLETFKVDEKRAYKEYMEVFDSNKTKMKKINESMREPLGFLSAERNKISKNEKSWDKKLEKNKKLFDLAEKSDEFVKTCESIEKKDKEYFWKYLLYGRGSDSKGKTHRFGSYVTKKIKNAGSNVYKSFYDRKSKKTE